MGALIERFDDWKKMSRWPDPKNPTHHYSFTSGRSLHKALRENLGLYHDFRIYYQSTSKIIYIVKAVDNELEELKLHGGIYYVSEERFIKILDFLTLTI